MIGLHIGLPQHCFADSCPCLNEDNGTCQADDQHRYVSVNKPSWCPLFDPVAEIKKELGIKSPSTELLEQTLGKTYWNHYTDDDDGYPLSSCIVCPKCGFSVSDDEGSYYGDYNYCPKCGKRLYHKLALYT